MSDGSNIHEMLSPEDQEKQAEEKEVDEVFKEISAQLKIGRSTKFNPKSKKDREWSEKFFRKLDSLMESLFNVLCWPDSKNASEGQIILRKEEKSDLTDKQCEPYQVYFHFFIGKRKSFLEPEKVQYKNKVLNKNIYGKDNEVLEMLKKLMKDAGIYKLKPRPTGGGSRSKFTIPFSGDDDLDM